MRGLWVEWGDRAPTGIHRTAVVGIRHSRCIPTTSFSTNNIRCRRTTSHYHSSICSSRPCITNRYHSNSNTTTTTTFNRLITAMDTLHNYTLLPLTVSGRCQCNANSTRNQREIGAP